MIETILFLAHAEAPEPIGRAGLEALQAAVHLTTTLPGSRLVVGFIGKASDKAAEQIGSCGAERFYAVSGTVFSCGRYATDALAAVALAKQAQASIVIAPGTSRMLRVLGGVGHRLGGKTDTHITGLEVSGKQLAVKRWFYRQRMVALVERQTRPWVLAIDTGSFPSWSGNSSRVSVEEVAVEVPPQCQRTTVTGTREPKAGGNTIRPDAQLLFVAGAGWTKKQADGETHVPRAAELIFGFLEKTGASLGSSKSLVDMGNRGEGVLPFLSHLNQVGQTGSTPRHPKGLATCCHGEEPHVVGWRFISERRAVNLDPNCGWAQGKADVLYVADAFQVVEKLNALL
jgi:electron transfer flavoprotein alpha subunit